MKFWMQTSRGKQFDYGEPYDLDLTIEDIARPLSYLPRFSGHANFHLTVAEHSLVVSKWCEPYGALVSLHALLHDAHEAFTGDMPGPFKAYIAHEYGVDISQIQATYQVNILAALNVPLLDDLRDVEL